MKKPSTTCCEIVDDRPCGRTATRCHPESLASFCDEHGGKNPTLFEAGAQHGFEVGFKEGKIVASTSCPTCPPPGNAYSTFGPCDDGKYHLTTCPVAREAMAKAKWPCGKLRYPELSASL